jgi:uncharacterized protein (DUF2062 family)
MNAMLVGDLSPHGWAISVSYGVAAGLFPIIGPVSLVSVLVVWLFRMHLPLVMLLVYGLYPLQLALMVPFGMVGKSLLPAQNALQIDYSGSFAWFYALGDWALAALVGWLLLMLPLGLICYQVALKFARRKKKLLSQPQPVD